MSNQDQPNRCCGTCHHWTKREGYDHLGRCRFPFLSVLPYWQSQPNTYATFDNDGNKCVAWKPRTTDTPP